MLREKGHEFEANMRDTRTLSRETNRKRVTLKLWRGMLTVTRTQRNVTFPFSLSNQQTLSHSVPIKSLKRMCLGLFLLLSFWMSSQKMSLTLWIVSVAAFLPYSLTQWTLANPHYLDYIPVHLQLESLPLTSYFLQQHPTTKVLYLWIESPWYRMFKLNSLFCYIKHLGSL